MLVLPLRSPIASARSLATIDTYSGGRVLCGVGIGWLREEADALHAPWDSRGRRSEEQVEVFRRLWTATGPVAFEGDWYGFPPIHAEPLPVQRPIPVLVGGHSNAAIERAGRIGDGWLASTTMPLGSLAEQWERVKRTAQRHGRQADGMRLVATASVALGTSESEPVGESVAEIVDRFRAYQDIGTAHLIVPLAGNIGSPLSRDTTSRTHLAALRLLASEVLPRFHF